MSGVHLFPFWRLGGYQCLGVGVEDGSDDSEPVLVGDLGRHVDTGQAAGRVNGCCLGVVGAGSVFSGVGASDEVWVVPKVFGSAG